MEGNTKEKNIRSKQHKKWKQCRVLRVLHWSKAKVNGIWHTPGEREERTRKRRRGTFPMVQVLWSEQYCERRMRKIEREREMGRVKKSVMCLEWGKGWCILKGKRWWVKNYGEIIITARLAAMEIRKTMWGLLLWEKGHSEKSSCTWCDVRWVCGCQWWLLAPSFHNTNRIIILPIIAERTVVWKTITTLFLVNYELWGHLLPFIYFSLSKKHTFDKHL